MRPVLMILSRSDIILKWVNGLLCNADTNIISITESNQVVRTVKKVSVIVPAYNVEKYIHRAIESVMQQTYENVELVIVDDGSSDATWDIIQQYAGQAEIMMDSSSHKLQKISSVINGMYG